MTKFRIIVGQGTSTEIFRQTVGFDAEYDTVIFGDRGLWARIPHHKMGQPPHALALPGQPVPKYQTAQGTTPELLSGFMDSSNYQEGLGKLSHLSDSQDGGVHFEGWRVTAIERGNGAFPLKVTYTRRDGTSGAFHADQVVVTTGIAPQKGHGIETSPSAGEIEKFTANRGFSPIQEGLQYIASVKKRKNLNTVIVYGGGATCAWLAELALERRPRRFWWVARQGGTGFTKAMLPGQRNQMVLDKLSHLRKEITIKSLKYIPAGESSRQAAGLPTRGSLFRRVNKDKILMEFEWSDYPQGRCFCLIDLFIYSIAGDPDASGSIAKIVAPGLFSELKPIRDTNLVLGPTGTAVLAWGTDKRDLLVIGAAAFSGMKLPKDTKVDAPMETLPWGSQVPDGIAVAVSTISAFNNYIPIKQQGALVTECNVNFNLADRNQIACYVAVMYDLLPAYADLCVDEIIRERSKKGADVQIDPTKPTNTPNPLHVGDAQHRQAFGLSETEIEGIIEKYRQYQADTEVD